MSRDYKKPSRTSGSSRKGKPMLTGVLLGLLIGLGLALGVAIFVNTMPNPFSHRGKTPETAPAAPAPIPQKPQKPAAESTTSDKPRFDFYTILPGKEDTVTDKDLKQAAKSPAASGNDQYFLQVGAFRTASEADNIKAKLALIGVEATIQTVSLPDKGLWHRVRVGPYGNADDLSRARSLLTQNGIDATLVRVHGDAAGSDKH